ncbi:MAG: MMPL family transporter [Burkholderiales bacterium]|uniref:MMPL family transporter n=1 Tax=Nitrosomonas sp. TaxID=42353 RepID=UPI001DA4DA2B|nr:MMPL family transporter [Nitrosomonas sp.]MCB1947451.1 MMPL family transporter [Nitrosomonas sp.]MCP5244011.1 MMPL family transporter [Burkholderiales bacterium]
MEISNGAGNRFFARWTAFSYQKAIWVIVLAVVIAGFSVLYTVNNLGVHTDTTDMLSEDVPFRINHKRYKEAFPQYEDALLLVVDAPAPELAHAAAKRLTLYLQNDKDHFYEASYLSGDPFFEQNGLLYKNISELENITDQLAAAQPLIARLAENLTLKTFASVLTEAVDEITQGRNLELDGVFNGMSATLDARLTGIPRALSWQILLDGERQTGLYQELVLTRPKHDYAQLFAAERSLNAVREAALSIGLTQDAPEQLRITGEAALAYDELHSAMRGAQDAGMLALALVVVVLLIALRTAGAIITVMLSLVLGLILTAAFATFAVGHLNLISIAFAVLYIGLGVDYAIHFLLRHEEIRRTGAPVIQTLPMAGSDIGRALTICAVTTAIGFYAFIPTSYDGVAELGIISGSGMIISLLVTLTIVPALQRFFPIQPIKPLISVRPLHTALEWPIHARKSVYILTVLAVLLSVFALPKIRFDYNLLNLNDPRAESVMTFRDLLENAEDSPWHIIALADSRNETEQLVQQLSELPEVDKVISILDFVPDDQEEKLHLIEEMAMTLGPISFTSATQERIDVDLQRAALLNLQSALTRFLDEQPAHTSAHAAKNLHASILGLQQQLDALNENVAREKLLSAIEQDLLHLLPVSIHRLQLALNASPFTLQDIPESVKLHWLSGNGVYRIAVYPAENINDNDALKRFVRAVQHITPGATGVPVISLEAGKAVVDAFIHAFSLAFIGVVVALLILLRNIKSAVLVLVPLLLAALFTGAVTVLLGLPFNFANVIALPLILGIGIDCSVHMVHRSRNNGEAYENLLYTSTARAIFYSALTTMAGFGSLIFSHHQGTASMGLLLLVGVVLTLVCVLVILPVLLHAADNKRTV